MKERTPAGHNSPEPRAVANTAIPPRPFIDPHRLKQERHGTGRVNHRIKWSRAKHARALRNSIEGRNAKFHGTLVDAFNRCHLAQNGAKTFALQQTEARRGATASEAFKAGVKAGTIAQADDVLMVPASKYTDPSRWQLEMDGIFRVDIAGQ